MKKILLMVLVTVMAVKPASAQKAIAESKTFDNWYIGIEGGVSSKTTHNAVFKNLNPHAGLRLGRYFTPVFGFAAEGSAYFKDKKFNQDRVKNPFVKAVDAHLLATVNLSNWFGGYLGKPRRVELVAIVGPGWNYVFGLKEGVGKADLTAKAGLDMNINLGKKRSCQIFLEPAILYNVDRYEHTTLKSDYSALQLMMGINYKFGNSNGTHNFVSGIMRDQSEIDKLNAQINELRVGNAEKDRLLLADEQLIIQLRTDLDSLQNVKPAVIQNVVKQVQVVNKNVLQPTVIFGMGKSKIDAAQMASVAMIAKYMKNHPTTRLQIKGYASPEGNPELNRRLSVRRAQAVKDALVQRYKVEPDRLVIAGMGATGELFDELDFNRVATFTVLSQ